MTDEEQVSQALAELWDIVKCRCHEAYTGRGLHDPDCECDSTDAVRTVANAITTLRAQLAEVSHMLALSKLTIEAVLTRADRAEAALAAQIEVDAGIADGFHQRAIEWAKSVRGLEKHIGETDSSRIAASIRNQPHDRTALDRVIAQTREKALRKAADAYFIPKFCPENDRKKVEALHAYRSAILALIEAPNAR